MHMLTKATILSLAKEKGRLYASDLVAQFSVSRQYVNRLVQDLVASGQLVKAKATRGAFYVLPEYAEQHPDILFPTFTIRVLRDKFQEDEIVVMIKKEMPTFQNLPGNVQHILEYALSEMLNNAIEHSRSEEILVVFSIKKEIVEFKVEDFGIGVFRNVMQKFSLNSELEAIQDILKGKTTTHAAHHSGEGIFFTSRVADLFKLSSFGYELIVDNFIKDIFIRQVKDQRQGTLVTFSIASDATRTTEEVFRQYTEISDEELPAFNKTEQKIRLYIDDTAYISRSQARRMLVGMEKFKVIRLDFDRVEMIGQGFADEIFRVFQNRHPEIRIEAENMNEVVQFMVQRAMNKGAP
jgi:anti-sigma regulatory factor (Ser/Thr protein kinase)